MKFLPTIYTNDLEVSMLIRGNPYFIKLELIYDDNGIPDRIEVLEFCSTKQSLDEKDWYSGAYVSWGGWPRFRQFEVRPANDDGVPYDFLCTINNHWGDMGNCNIFVEFSGPNHDLVIKDIYMEFSCS